MQLAIDKRRSTCRVTIRCRHAQDSCLTRPFNNAVAVLETRPFDIVLILFHSCEGVQTEFTGVRQGARMREWEPAAKKASSVGILFGGSED